MKMQEFAENEIRALDVSAVVRGGDDAEAK
jgi:hypothetical protein